MKVASDFSRPAFASLYEVAGRFVFIAFADPVTQRSIETFLDRWRVSLLQDLEQPRIDVNLTFEIGVPPVEEERFEEFALGDGNIGYATDTDYRILFPNRALIAADESDTVRIWLTEPLEADDDLLPQLISHSLSAALRRCDVFELHSGAVVSGSNSQSVLICGPSGSGKSTLTLQLAASGWSFLSDDAVLLSVSDHLVKATGVRRFFALTRQTVEESGLPELHGLDGNEAEHHRKISLVPEDFFPSGSIEECTPNLLLFPVITEEAGSLTCELSPAEAMSRLIRMCPWSCYDRAVARGFLNVLTLLVKQSQSYDLFAGSDLLGDPAFTSSFLATTFAKQ